MDDDQKKSGRSGPRRDGGAGKSFGKAGPRKPGGKKFDGPRREGGPQGERSGGKPRGDRPFRKPGEDRERPLRTEGERPPRREDGDRPRPRPARADGDRPFRKPREDGGRGFDKRDGDRAERPRYERSGEDRPKGDRPRFDRPKGDRPGFDGPRRDGPRRDGPRRDGPRRDGPRGDNTGERREEGAVAPEPERIAKRLARAGISSRRDAEEMVLAGRVKVNGVVLTSPAHNVVPGDVIHIDNELLPQIERTRLFLFHKPAGVVTTNRDPQGRQTVFDILPAGLPRLITVGRLDINTEGLLLLTNDGGLARVLELPSTGWLRRYRARVHGKVDEQQLRNLKDGIAVDGVFYGSIEAHLDREQGSNAWLTIGLREGKNREVKNVLGALGLEVSRLIRVSFGPFQLGELAEGAVMELKGRTLRDQLGERLIEEAGANFDAPIVNEFSNKPVRQRDDDRPERPPPRRDRRMDVGEGGLVKGRKRDRDERRTDALDRLQTSRPARDGAKRDGANRDGARGSGGKDRKKTEKPFEPPRSRSSNVWMAPGARPTGKPPRDAQPDRERKPRTDSKPRTDARPRPGGSSGGPRRPRRDD